MEPPRNHWYLKEVKSHIASSTHVKSLETWGNRLFRQGVDTATPDQFICYSSAL
jgi:hypothetical protein